MILLQCLKGNFTDNVLITPNSFLFVSLFCSERDKKLFVSIQITYLEKIHTDKGQIFRGGKAQTNDCFRILMPEQVCCGKVIHLFVLLVANTRTTDEEPCTVIRIGILTHLLAEGGGFQRLQSM